jgi:tungstate transport system ATP-binding protein
VSDPVLTLHGLRKRHGSRLLLDVTRLAIPRGACTVLSGPNGAGKSTLLRIVAGLESADEGELEYQGRHVSCRRSQRDHAGQIVYLHQDPYLFDGTVAANIAYGLRPRGLPKPAVRERVERALRLGRLEQLADRSARELSGGERQRVALMRAWVLSPAVLLLDEPMANLDRAAREQTCALIEQLKREMTSMIIVSHDVHQLAGVGDHYLYLEQGRLRALDDLPQPEDEKMARIIERIRTPTR